MRKIELLFLLLFSNMCFGQIVINELDSDTEGIDYEEFIELKTADPFTSLDDYVVVFFNGSEAGGNRSYLTIDLSGYTSDINGIFLIGSNYVQPFPHLIIPPNIIQNGADAVAIYQGDAEDYPDWTLATTDHLIDALVYGNGHPTSTDLLELLGQTQQWDEDINGNKDFESIQRDEDGTYFVAPPTPGRPNDGTGVELNAISVDIPQDRYTEGDEILLTFTTDFPVEEDLNFEFSLDFENFNEADYQGETTVTISKGSTQTSQIIYILEDGIDEGDEKMVFQFGTIPPNYIKSNDFIEVIIIDGDFQVADFGSPLNPTYGEVESSAPDGYYQSIDGLAGNELRQALQDIIADPETVRAHSYADIVDILKVADQNPENSHEVWLLYLEKGRPKIDYQITSNSVGKWNREHTFPRSRGGFYPREGDDVADGIHVYWSSSADSIRHGYSDAHALRAADGPENTRRSNQNYGPLEYSGPEDTQGSFYGDVARGIFYMDIRYNGLSVVEGYPSVEEAGQLGDLLSLLEWNRIDPSDDFEMNRNNIIYEWQRNRNPFIDYPDLAEYIWGDHAGEVWHLPEMDQPVFEKEKVVLYPNPSQDHFSIKGIQANANYQIFNLAGQMIQSGTVNPSEIVRTTIASGVYLIKVYDNLQVHHLKLIIE